MTKQTTIFQYWANIDNVFNYLIIIQTAIQKVQIMVGTSLSITLVSFSCSFHKLFLYNEHMYALVFLIYHIKKVLLVIDILRKTFPVNTALEKKPWNLIWHLTPPPQPVFNSVPNTCTEINWESKYFLSLTQPFMHGPHMLQLFCFPKTQCLKEHNCLLTGNTHVTHTTSPPLVYSDL